MGNRAWWMELNYRGQRSLGKITPSTCPTCPIMERSAEWLRLTNAVYQPPPHPLPPFLYNNKNNNHENSICLPAPITPLLLSPFHPPAHCLAHSRRRKFIKMKLRLQLTGFIKIYLPLTDDACCATEDKRGTMNNLVRYFFFCVMFLTFCVCLHKYDFSHEILVDYSLLYHNTDLGKLHPDFFFFFLTYG